MSGWDEKRQAWIIDKKDSKKLKEPFTMNKLMFIKKYIEKHELNPKETQEYIDSKMKDK